MSIFDRDIVRILVVDDEDLVRKPLTEALSWAGYHADEADSVQAALAILRRERYDLLFCDLVMPGEDGFALMKTAHTLYPELTIIVLTGHATVELTQRAVHLGAQDFLVKPFSVRELPIIVERNLERMRLERQLRAERTEHLLFQTVQALTAAIEAKDPYTAGHSRKVSELSMAFASALSLSTTDHFVLRLAGMMHDVGKIGIPEHILLKSGTLDEDEWETMRQHPIIGAEIVSQVTDLDFVAKVVRAHHERWDGSGYPDNLYGDTIPLLSRILYLSDTYDALTADRAYRKGMPHEQALSIIYRNAGVHYDTELVNILENQVLPSLGPDWHLPIITAPHLSRTTREAMNSQMAAPHTVTGLFDLPAAFDRE